MVQSSSKSNQRQLPRRWSHKVFLLRFGIFWPPTKWLWTERNQCKQCLGQFSRIEMKKIATWLVVAPLLAVFVSKFSTLFSSRALLVNRKEKRNAKLVQFNQDDVCGGRSLATGDRWHCARQYMRFLPRKYRKWRKPGPPYGMTNRNYVKTFVRIARVAGGKSAICG